MKVNQSESNQIKPINGGGWGPPTAFRLQTSTPDPRPSPPKRRRGPSEEAPEVGRGYRRADPDDAEGVEDISRGLPESGRATPESAILSTHHFRAKRGARPAIASERRRKRSEFHCAPDNRISPLRLPPSAFAPLRLCVKVFYLSNQRFLNSSCGIPSKV